MNIKGITKSFEKNEESLINRLFTICAPKNGKKLPVAKVIKPKGDALLIITEKPQAANKIAQALGNARKITTPDKVSYFELNKDGKEILIASAVGHLFGLDYVKGQKGWPIFNIEWVPAYNKKAAAFTKRYYNTLKRLFQ